MTPRARKWLRTLGTVAQHTIHLTRASHPIALVSAGISLATEFFGDCPDEPSCWPHVPWTVRAALAAVAVEAQLGKVISRDREGDEIREHNGCRFGWSFADGREWVHGPAGDPTAIPRFIWEHLGTAIHVAKGHASDATMDGVALRPDPMKGAALGKVGSQAASEIAALRRDGAPVGALFEGVRGGGKSWAMRAIAAELGGFSIRARLSDIREDQLLGFVHVLAPKTVIFDDIDRGETSQALDLIEVLTDRGIVVLASCNRTGQVDDSLIRARRLGLHYSLESIETELFDSMTRDRGLSEETLAVLRSKTVAEVSEFVDHAKSLGEQRAMEILLARKVGGAVKVHAHRGNKATA